MDLVELGDQGFKLCYIYLLSLFACISSSSSYSELLNCASAALGCMGIQKLKESDSGITDFLE